MAGNGTEELRFPRDGFSIEAVKRAAYMVMAKYDIIISSDDRDIVCSLAPAHAGVPMDQAARDFRREVIDQDLRISIEQRTENYRDTILALAFSQTGLQGG